MQLHVSFSFMGRKKFALKKTENSTAQQVSYSKCEDGMIKKANELAVLCDTDVGLIMFSPSGQLTCFSSSGRVEDIFLRFMDLPDGLGVGSTASQELLIQKLRKLKYEAEMLEKIAYIEALEEKLKELDKQKCKAIEKMSYYQPELEKISSSLEADVHLRFLEGALQHIQLAKAKLLGKEVEPQGLGKAEGIIPYSEVAAFSAVGESSTANQSADLQQTRAIDIPREELDVEEYLPKDLP